MIVLHKNFIEKYNCNLSYTNFKDYAAKYSNYILELQSMLEPYFNASLHITGKQSIAKHNAIENQQLFV